MKDFICTIYLFSVFINVLIATGFGGQNEPQGLYLYL